MTRPRFSPSTSQMCWMMPGPATSIRTAVSPALTRMKGRTFQPWPRSSAARALATGLGSVGLGIAMPPLPFSPVGFSAEIDRVRPRPRRGRLPRPGCRPMHAPPAIPPPDIPAAIWPSATIAAQLEMMVKAAITKRAWRLIA